MNPHADYASNAAFQLTDPDAGEVLILLHGLGADHRQPLALLSGMGPTGWATLAPDLRAHGATATIGVRSDFRFDAMVADVKALMQRLGLGGKPVHIVGISMGAAIGLRAGLTAALDVRSLVLIRPAFDVAPLPPNLRVMAQIGEMLRDCADPAAARVEFERSRVFREVASVSPLGAASLLSQFDAELAVERSIRLRSVPRNSAYPSRSALTTVAAPTLVVGTAYDPVHPLPLAHEWHAGIPGASFAEIPPRDVDPAVSAARLRELVQDRLRFAQAASWT
jgi:pimeloyl-ACP methyl ester carboxylesterase